MLPATAASDNTPMARFSLALKEVLQVSKADLRGMLAEEQKMQADRPKRGRKPKTSA